MAIKNKDIVCISTIDWGFLYQRHQIFMEAFAGQGNRVYYIENLNPSPRIEPSFFLKAARRIKRITANPGAGAAEGIKTITPLLIPFKGRFSYFINKNLLIKRLAGILRSHNINSPIVWTYLATPLALQLAKELNPSLLIYDCVFDAGAHPDSPKDILESEQILLKEADIVFTDNLFLFEKCSRINQETCLVPPGVDYAIFQEKPGSRFAGLKGPKICFFGGIDDLRLDLGLIRFIAEKKPEWNIVLIGPVIKTGTSSLKAGNITLAPPVEHRALPALLAEMDALILPYKIIPFSQSIFPAKIFECLATGKPVICTPLPQLKELAKQGAVKIAAEKEQFLAAIEHSLGFDTEEEREKRKNIARSNSWQKRIADLNAAIEKRAQGTEGQR